MRILLVSYAFYPSIGGIESTSMIFATGMANRGCEVTVVTSSPREDASDDGVPEFVRVVRQPGLLQLIRLIREADIVWSNNVSLRFLWPLLFISKPSLITHNGLFSADGIRGKVLGIVKRCFCSLGTNVFVSTAVKERQGLHGPIIPNPYDDSVFRAMPGIPRTKDIAFVGRLVTGKGVHTLIDAISILVKRGIGVGVSIIGSGPELENLQTQAVGEDVAYAVSFPGPMRGDKLVAELNRHKVLAVPSCWEEAFGVVALEGAACGCVVVATADGGLPEAVGPSGPIVPPRDPAGLAEALLHVLTNEEVASRYRLAGSAHVEQFTCAHIVDRYEALLCRLCRDDA